MSVKIYRRKGFLGLVRILAIASAAGAAHAQDKIKIAYSSTDTLNQIWTIPYETGLYKSMASTWIWFLSAAPARISAMVAQDI